MDSCNIFIVCLLSSELITLTKIHLQNMSPKTMFLIFDWRESNANVRIMRVFLSYIFLETSRVKEDLYERDDRDGHVGSGKVETVQTDNESTGRTLFGDRRMHEDSRPHHSSTQPDASTLKYKRALGFAGFASLSLLIWPVRSGNSLLSDWSNLPECLSNRYQSKIELLTGLWITWPV